MAARNMKLTRRFSKLAACIGERNNPGVGAIDALFESQADAFPESTVSYVSKRFVNKQLNALDTARRTPAAVNVYRF
jgi:hypothetical protein